MPTPTVVKPDTENSASPPGSLLSDCVALFWSHTAPQGAPPRRELSLPEGTVELVLNLADPTERGMLVCGPHSRPFLAETPEGASLLAVHFHPSGAFPFFDLPLTELHNQIVPLEALWGPSARILRDSLQDATPENRFALLENALQTRWCSRRPCQNPITIALHQFNQSPNTRIAAVADAVGWSERHLNRVFREEVGLSPKRYCRIRRFQTALRQIPTAGSVHWAELAQTCGYFDQAHLVHDFHTLAGVTPTAYQTQRDRHPNHLSV